MFSKVPLVLKFLLFSSIVPSYKSIQLWTFSIKLSLQFLFMIPSYRRSKAGHTSCMDIFLSAIFYYFIFPISRSVLYFSLLDFCCNSANAWVLKIWKHYQQRSFTHQILFLFYSMETSLENTGSHR